MELYLLLFTAIFSVVNPLGAIPIYVTLTEGISPSEQRRNVLKIGIYIVAILLTFYFAGNYILMFFGIELTHIKIAGGIMICMSAMSLLGKDAFKGKTMADEVQEESKHKNDITFTPMAMPMLSGPGAIALVIGLHTTVDGTGFWGLISLILAVVSVAVISGLALLFSDRINKFLGKSGMAALSRMTGFIILSIGISMILNGLVPVFQTN